MTPKLDLEAFRAHLVECFAPHFMIIGNTTQAEIVGAIDAALAEIRELRGELAEARAHQQRMDELNAVGEKLLSVAVHAANDAANDRDRPRVLLGEACDLADGALPDVPCDMSDEVARIAAIRKEGGLP